MSLQDRLIAEMKEAMKSGYSEKVSVIRMLRSSLKNKEIDKRRALTEQEILETITSSIKQRRESIEEFKKGNRPDLTEKEEKEITILQSFLPPQLTKEELEAKIRATIEEIRAEGIKDLGRVMKALMPEVSGRAEGKVVSDLVRALLERE